MALVIRDATKDDALLLQTLGRKTFADTFTEFNTPENMQAFLDETYSLERIQQELADPSAVYFVVYDGCQCAGFARLRFGNSEGGIDGNVVEIQRLYAVKEYIGKNVGSFLMEECLERARQRNADAVWLGVWEHNSRAVRFYEKYGFRKFSEHVFHVGNDPQTDWLMKKNLK